MDEKTLPPQVGCRKIIAIVLGRGMEMQVTPWCHRHPARLEGKPFAPTDRDARIVDGRPENALRERYLSGRKWPLAADLAGCGNGGIMALYVECVARIAQRSSPAAWIGTVKVADLPPATVRVMAVSLPATRSGERSNAMI